MVSPEHPLPYAVCNTCTINLVGLAYSRAPWFRLVREPLRMGMITLGWCYRIDSRNHLVHNENCCGCLRFIKTGLKEKSTMFRWLNNRVNPIFDRILESIVTVEEVLEAKNFAREATQPEDN